MVVTEVFGLRLGRSGSSGPSGHKGPKVVLTTWLWGWDLKVSDPAFTVDVPELSFYSHCNQLLFSPKFKIQARTWVP